MHSSSRNFVPWSGFIDSGVLKSLVSVLAEFQVMHLQVTLFSVWQEVARRRGTAVLVFLGTVSCALSSLCLALSLIKAG